MRIISTFIYTILLVFAIQSVAVAQSVNLTETFKKSFNETVQEVQSTDDAAEKRTLLNEKLARMIDVIERIESKAQLSEDESNQLTSYKAGLVDKKNELNGLDGFEEILDEDLDDFSDYSQQFFEQANRTITIGVGTAILIAILLLIL
jgi:soluble cytochrome b562